MYRIKIIYIVNRFIFIHDYNTVNFHIKVTEGTGNNDRYTEVTVNGSLLYYMTKL